MILVPKKDPSSLGEKHTLVATPLASIHIANGIVGCEEIILHFTGAQLPLDNCRLHVHTLFHFRDSWKPLQNQWKRNSLLGMNFGVYHLPEK